MACPLPSSLTPISSSSSFLPLYSVIGSIPFRNASLDTAMNALPQQHDVLWFSDGNIVLATDSLLFRVHRGVLSLHSTVLRDMFDLPFAEPVDEGVSSSTTSGHSTDGIIKPDTYEGLPMVMLSGDNGADVAHLLRAVYERGYYNRDDDDTPLDKIIALLTLSAKYDVATVRADVLKQLSRNYPTTLPEYEASMANETLFGLARRACHFPLLRAASITSESQTDIRVILPSLYHACVALPARVGLGKETLPIPMPILAKMLFGERRLTNLACQLLTMAIDRKSPLEGCPHNASIEECKTTRRFPQTQAMMNLLFTSVRFTVKGDEVVDTFFERRCEECRKDLGIALQVSRKIVWEKIPEYFELESWDAVRGTASG